ncbi:hypothetical protein [Parasphingopyxis algicola]|uniref:hypothetical protein n=1 Tax=Parasphingopyxis algicola TaxID=2026624 RepID=UPI001FEB53AE|nr:hypothetical protein [Parasphingopyxis algicola]
MASRWRRRRMCVLHADAPAPAALETVSGRGATVRSNAQPACGSTVKLVHPAAGEIVAEVHAISETGIELSFAGDEDSVGFALSAVAADMTRSS